MIGVDEENLLDKLLDTDLMHVAFVAQEFSIETIQFWFEDELDDKFFR